MHNNGLDHMYTERGGLVYDGVDLSVSEGAKTVMTINEVKKVDNNLVIKWGATFNGVATDPCFVGPATSGKPAFAACVPWLTTARIKPSCTTSAS